MAQRGPSKVSDGAASRRHGLTTIFQHSLAGALGWDRDLDRGPTSLILVEGKQSRMSSATEAAERKGATERPAAEQQQFQFPVSNSIFKECRRLGDAIWLYLFYIDRTTKERRDEDGTSVGLVLGGVPRSDSDAARALGVCDKTINRWRSRLEREGFIRTKQTGRGSIVEIVNSTKWCWKKKKAGRTEKSEQIGLDSPSRPDEVVRADRTKRSVPYIDNTATVQGQNSSATDVATARDFATETYRQKFNETPNWMKKDSAQLDGLFARKPDLTLEEFRRRWQFYLQSDSNFYRSQGYRLGFFCSHSFDALRDGPQNDRGREAEEKPFGGLSRKELERRRTELSPEARKQYEEIGVTRPV